MAPGAAVTPRVYATFIGCKVSQADSEAAAAALSGLGWKTCAEPREADACVLMTCCVTGEAEKKSRRLARRLAADGRRVLVAGCAATRDAGQFAHPGIETVQGGWEAVARRLGRVQEHGKAAPDVRAARTRTRFNLKVQDGCGGSCTYCVVREVRGRPRSLPPAEAVAAARAAVARGCGEVVLTGIDLGAYDGRDPRAATRGAGITDGTGPAGGRIDLARLVLALAEVPGLLRLRLSSLEPDTLDDGLLGALAHPLVARHLHLPLQSADDGVLQAMGRRYDWAGFERTVRAVRSHLPDSMLSTDVIVGFPAEDDTAFERTLDALDSGLFGRVHVFSYSVRPGTPAERLGRLPASVVKERAAVAGEAAAAAQRRAAARTIGRPAEVLVEDRHDGLWRGYSSQYVRYHLRGEARPGALVRAVALEARGDGVVGRVETILS